MEILKQVSVVFIICFIGEIVSQFLPLPFPGSVIAMLLLFLCLIFRIVKAEKIKTLSDFLLKNMTLLFIPATVSIIEYTQVLKSVFWRFLFICLITTVICFVCTAYSVKLTIMIMNKIKGRRNRNA